MNQQTVLQRLFLTLLHLELVDILERLQMDSRDFLHFDLLDAILFLSFLVFQKITRIPRTKTRQSENQRRVLDRVDRDSDQPGP